jgi:hypothetical protein
LGYEPRSLKQESASTESFGHASRQSWERIAQLRQGCDDACTGNHYQIDPGWQSLLVQAKGFAEQPFPAVADHGVANFSGNRQPKAGMRQFVKIAVNDNLIVGDTAPAAKRSLKINAAPNAIG